jgi:large subunit ribosomal protein L25
MERVELQAKSRDVHGKKAKQLRAESWVPAVMYGPDTPSLSIQADERLLSRAIMTAGSTSLINLSIEGETKPHVVLAREIQRNPVNDRLLHVDFLELRLTEMVKTFPRLVIIGEAPIVKSGAAVLIHGMTEVEVECLPTDLINSIEVDISALEGMGDAVTVGQLPVPPGVTILADPNDVVVSVVPARVELEEVEEEVWEEEGIEIDQEGEEEEE